MSKVLEQKVRDGEVAVASMRGACAPQVSQSLEELNWIPRPRLLALRRLGIETVEDLLTHFPRRHEDRTEFPRFPREESDVPVCLCGEVVKTSLRRFGGWKKIFEATLQESQANALSEPLVCRWFNLHYVQKMIATGQRIVVFGKPRLRGKRICMDHPEFEVIENDEEISIHFRRITPIYPATEGLSQRALRSIVYRLLNELRPAPAGFKTLLPRALMNGDMTRAAAIRAIHFPKNWEERDAAREHLVLSEFFAMQMLIASRGTDASIRTGEAHCGSGVLLDRFLKALPFELTRAQEKVIAEIHHDLAATMCCGAGSSRWAYASHYERPRDRRRAGRCRCLSIDGIPRAKEFRGAQAASLSCPAACRTHERVQCPKARMSRTIIAGTSHTLNVPGPSTRSRLPREIIANCRRKRVTSCSNQSCVGRIGATNCMRPA